MAHIKNQNMFHVVDTTGKKTKCGLSNQSKMADPVEKFNKYLQDVSLVKFCCKKCRS